MIQNRPRGPHFTPAAQGWSHRFWLLGLLALGLSACAQPQPQSTTAQPSEEVPAITEESVPWTSADSGAVGQLRIDDGDNTLGNETWSSASNGYGPIELNTSNGGRNSGDGKPLTIGGHSYAKGFGAHANSQMTFALGGRCATFTADVGVDDEVGAGGSVTFAVLADGQKLFDSGTLTGKDTAKPVSVSVAGKNELKLIVDGAGDGQNVDHADWASPTLRGCVALQSIRINAGGPAQTVDGVTWSGCESVDACNGYVTGGFAYAEPSKPRIANVLSPASEAMYQTEWTGGATQGVGVGETAFAYKVPVPNGPYQVRLHFAELNKSAPGQRLFDVNLEGGAAELTGYDVYEQAGGKNRAVVRTLPVTVSDGVLNIDFIRGVENAKLSGLEILPDNGVAGGELTAAPPELVYSGTQDAVSAPQTLTVGNKGSAPLRVTALAFTGKDAGAFELVAPPALPLTLAPGQNLSLQARLRPQGVVGALSAALSVQSDDPDQTPLRVNLYGLSARGLQGNLEPPLQQIVNTLGYAVDVGGSNLILGTQPTLIGDEVAAGLFVQAGSGPVTIKAVARYSPDDLLPFGYYTSGGASPAQHQVAVIARGGEQTLNPALVAGGADSFDPGGATFGFYVGATSYAKQNSYTQDTLNTGQTKHSVRVYPLKNRAGELVANSYLLAFEPAVNGDYQDYVFVVGNVKLAAAPTPTSFAWTVRAAAPAPRSEAQGAVVNGKLYVFGGFDTHLRAMARSDAYDPDLDRWTGLPDMPEPSTHVAVAADGQTLYFAGGFIGTHPGPQTDHVWKYDTRANTWSAGPALPAARGAGALVRLGRELHFFGGTERDLKDRRIYKRDSGDHWVLQLDGGTSWTTAAPLPNPRNHIAGVALDGKIYAIGGQHLGNEVSGDQSEVDVYDPATKRWARVSSLPLPLGHINASTVIWNGHIIVLAGLTLQSREAANVFEYDPSANTWSELASLPGPRKSPVAGGIGDRMIVTGGTFLGDATTTTWSGIR